MRCLVKKMKKSFIYWLDYIQNLKYRLANTVVVSDIIIC